MTTHQEMMMRLVTTTRIGWDDIRGAEWGDLALAPRALKWKAAEAWLSVFLRTEPCSTDIAITGGWAELGVERNQLDQRKIFIDAFPFEIGPGPWDSTDGMLIIDVGTAFLRLRMNKLERRYARNFNEFPRFDRQLGGPQMAQARRNFNRFICSKVDAFKIECASSPSEAIVAVPGAIGRDGIISCPSLPPFASGVAADNDLAEKMIAGGTEVQFVDRLFLQGCRLWWQAFRAQAKRVLLLHLGVAADAGWVEYHNILPPERPTMWPVHTQEI